MKTQTHIATKIDSISPERLRIDESIKELLADVQILARILKYTVSELQSASIDEIIACIDESQIEIGKTSIEPGITNYGKVQRHSGEDTIQNEGTIYFDIRFPIYYGKDSIKIIINLEAQNRIHASELKYHLENRIIYYLSRLISSQKNVEFLIAIMIQLKKYTVFGYAPTQGHKMILLTNYVLYNVIFLEKNSHLYILIRCKVLLSHYVQV